LEKIKEKFPHLVCVFITGTSNIGIAIEATKKGAYDFLEKPFEPDKVTVLLNKVHKEFFNQTRVEYLEAKLNSGQPFVVGHKYQLRSILEVVESISRAQVFSVLIKGESGTGKEVLARYIHQKSLRSKQPFIDVNCAAIPATLLESELFGYERGAFTGADRLKIGLLEMAQGGILFLDEIGDMPLEMQAKLLRALESKFIRRVGGMENIPIDVAVISATNKDLDKLIAEHKFREDLYYRINIIPINLPPLRERAEDIPELVTCFIERFNLSLGKKIRGVAPGVLELLQKYAFPGNIRELRNIIERAMILEKGSILAREHFTALTARVPVAPVEMTTVDLDFTTYKKQLVLESEKKYLTMLLQRTAGNVTTAAQQAGLPRTSLSRLLSKHNLHFKEFKA
jgi:DNA-binding NtrC family response regulator